MFFHYYDRRVWKTETTVIVFGGSNQKKVLLDQFICDKYSLCTKKEFFLLQISFTSLFIHEIKMNEHEPNGFELDK